MNALNKLSNFAVIAAFGASIVLAAMDQTFAVSKWFIENPPGIIAAAAIITMFGVVWMDRVNDPRR